MPFGFGFEGGAYARISDLQWGSSQVKFDQLVREAVGEEYLYSMGSEFLNGCEDGELLYIPSDREPKLLGGFTFQGRENWSLSRYQNRKRTRQQLIDLINASIGSDYATIKRGWLFEESIGNRLVRDCVPQGFLSSAKIDDKAFIKILRRVHVLRQMTAEAAFRDKTYRSNTNTFQFSSSDLKTLYSRADNLPQHNSGGPVLGDDRRNHQYRFNEYKRDYLFRRDADTRKRAISIAQAVAQGDDGAKEELDQITRSGFDRTGDPDLIFALSEVYRKGIGGVARDLDQGNVLLISAVNMRSEKAGEDFGQLIHEDDPGLYYGIYQHKLLSDSRHDSPFKAFCLLKAASLGHDGAVAALDDLKQNGDATIRFIISEYYRSGLRPVDKDLNEADNWHHGADQPIFAKVLKMLGDRCLDGPLHFSREKWMWDYDPNFRASTNEQRTGASYHIRAIEQGQISVLEKVERIADDNDGPPSLFFKLGTIHEEGRGGAPVDLDCARKYYRRADTNNLNARDRALVRAKLGIVDYDGLGGAAKNYDRARDYLELADTDDLNARNRALVRAKLGEVHYAGLGSAGTNYDRARDYFERADTADLTIASERAFVRANLGNIHYAGLGSATRNYNRARHYFELADTDDLNARDRAYIRANLGNIHYRGLGNTKVEYNKARDYLELADTDDLSARDRASVRRFLGKLHYDGKGSADVNYDRALEYLELADTDDLNVRDRAYIRRYLGSIHYRGLGNAHVNFDRARNYFERADADDLLNARDRALIRAKLGRIHYDGLGSAEKNYDRARVYFELADTDDAGPIDRAEARYYLGLGKKEGDGTDVDLVGAARLIILAARGGNQDAINEIEACKQNGPPEYQFAMAELYRNGGDIGATNIAKAWEFYRRAANENHPGALYRLGCMFRDGQAPNEHVINADLQAAVWLYRAAQLGNPEAAQAIDDIKRNGPPALRFAMRELYANGFDAAPPNHSAAGALYAGDDQPAFADILYRLGMMYKDGRLGDDHFGIHDQEVNLPQAVDYLLRAVDQGQLDTARRELGNIADDNEGPHRLYIELGKIYEKGRGVTQANLGYARGWYLRAANEDNIAAQYALARCYAKDGDQHVPQAMLWLTRAAKNGNRDAQNWLDRIARKGPVAQQMALAHAYDNGIDWPLPDVAIPNDIPIARRRRLEDEHDAMRTGVEADRRAFGQGQALKWRHCAALRGDAEAQYQYALCCQEGRGCAPDEAQYLIWLSRAAEGGHRDAQFALALFYQGARDKFELANEAFVHWLHQAAAQGHEAAGDLVAALNISAPRPFRNVIDAPPAWWPVAERLIKDQLNQLTALALLDVQRANAWSEKRIVQNVVGVDNDDQTDAVEDEVVQQPIAMLIDAYKALRRHGVYNEDEHSPRFDEAQRALDQYRRTLNKDAPGAASKRYKELGELQDILNASCKLAADIQRFRKNHISYAEDMLRPIAQKTGLAA